MIASVCVMADLRSWFDNSKYNYAMSGISLCRSHKTTFLRQRFELNLSNRTIIAAAEAVGINVSLMAKWVKAFRESSDPATAFSGEGH